MTIVTVLIFVEITNWNLEECRQIGQILVLTLALTATKINTQKFPQ